MSRAIEIEVIFLCYNGSIERTRKDGSIVEERVKSKESERLNASLIFSLQILDYLETAESASLAELSEAVKINKSRVIRLCGTMEHMGYLIQRGDGRYFLGPRLLSLGRAFERYNPLLQVLRPVVAELSEELDENVMFQVIRSGKRLCICSVNRAQSGRYTTPEGSEAKFPYGAASKVLLTWGPPELRAKILKEAPYPRYTENTPVTSEELLAALSQTQARGYGISYAERTYGSAALSVPIFGADGILLGALSVAGTMERMTPEFVEKALPRLKKAAAYVQSMTAGAARFEPRIPRPDR